MATFGDNLGEKRSKKEKLEFVCYICDVICCSKYNFDRHLLTPKHKKRTNGDILVTEVTEKEKKENMTNYTCKNCNKLYYSRNGLWRHNKTCCVKKYDIYNIKEITNQITPELILDVMKQNKDLTNLIVEQNKTIMELSKNNQYQMINSNNVNSNNKTFNLNMFLNETCKDAMNITDFVDSLQLQLSDLENIGKVGFVEGISNIIVKNLQALDIHKRPVHCTDKKREILYIKDEDKWERETEEKNTIRKVIKKVAYKNQRLLPKFKEAHPGCNYSESKYSDQYSKLVIESMGDNDIEKENKIIKNIAKEVFIDKK